MPTAIENNLGQKASTGHFYLTEISNLVFPQHINPDGYSLSIINLPKGNENELDHPFIATELLSLFVEHRAVNYLRETLDFTLKFPPEDIIYPFYDFW